jgi:hypothetical protein
MRTLVQISIHKGYVDIPIENDKPNPYTTNMPNSPRLYTLEMEILESPDFEVGTIQNMVFKRGQVKILAED